MGAASSPLGMGRDALEALAGEIASAAGIQTSIVDRLEPGALVAARRGERAGTRFHTRATRVSASSCG